MTFAKLTVNGAMSKPRAHNWANGNAMTHKQAVVGRTSGNRWTDDTST